VRERPADPAAVPQAAVSEDLVSSGEG